VNALQADQGSLPGTGAPVPGRGRPRGAGASYALRVDGHLDQHWSTWFDGFTITHEDDSTTTLQGVVTDQSELHGLLAKVRDLGVPLISLQPLQAAGDGDSQ
jgi:hypothetical protein